MAPIEASYLIGLISYVNRLLLHSEIIYNNRLLRNLAVILVVPVLWKQVFAPDTVLPPLPGWVGAECKGKWLLHSFGISAVCSCTPSGYLTGHHNTTDGQGKVSSTKLPQVQSAHTHSKFAKSSDRLIMSTTNKRIGMWECRTGWSRERAGCSWMHKIPKQKQMLHKVSCCSTENLALFYFLLFPSCITAKNLLFRGIC